MRDIGKNIRDMRESKNLTQDQLAEKLFVTRQTVSNYETGKTRPDVDMILRIAQVLDTDANCVFYGMPAQADRRREFIKSAITALIALAAVIALLVFKDYAMAYKNTTYKVGPAMLYGCLLRPLVTLGCGWCVMQVLSPVFISLGESNRYRLTAPLFGAFSPFRLDGRQPIFVSKSENPSKIDGCQVQGSFAGAVFRSGKAKAAGNTDVFPRTLTQHGRKFARQNRQRFDSPKLKLKPIRSRTARIAQIVLIAVLAVILVLMTLLVLNSFQPAWFDIHPIKMPVIGTIINAVYRFDYYTHYCGYIVAGAAIWTLRAPKKPENAASDKPSCKW